MKAILMLTCLLVALISCRKNNPDFLVRGEVNGKATRLRTLLITDNKGNILHTLKVVPGETAINADLPSNEALSDLFDAHLLDIDSMTGSIIVYSQLDIPNGTPFFIGKSYRTESSASYKIQVEGIIALDSFIEAGLSYAGFSFPYFDSTTQSVYYTLNNTRNDGVILRIIANGEKEYRSLCIQNDQLVRDDTTKVHWQHFGKETNVKTILLPDNNLPYAMEVRSLSDDLRTGVLLERRNAAPNKTVIPNFVHPAGLPENSTYAIKVKYSDIVQEKVIYPGDPLLFQNAGIGIADLQLSSTKVKLKVTGDPMWVKIHYDLFADNGGNGAILWIMEGQPAAFADHSLPNITAFFPGNIRFDHQELIPGISVYNFDHLNASQIRNGYPYRDSDVFALAKSGYTEVQK